MPARLPLFLRASVLAALGLLLVWPPLRSEDSEAPDLAGPGAPFVRRSTEPPTLAELDHLAGLDVPVFAALPELPLSGDMEAPRSPRVGRAAAIAWSAHGRPG